MTNCNFKFFYFLLKKVYKSACHLCNIWLFFVKGQSWNVIVPGSIKQIWPLHYKTRKKIEDVMTVNKAINSNLRS